MIRSVTMLCLLAAGGSGLYLYGEKHRTELLDREIARTIHATEAARARTGLLRAEWAVANEPGRLGDMAGRYLALHPMAPTQFVPVAELATHLPAPIATQADAADTDEDAAPAAPAMPEATLVASNADAAATPVPAPPPHHSAAAQTGRAVQPPKLLAGAAPRAPRHHGPAELADGTTRALLPRGTPLPLAAPQPVGAAIYSAMARPMRVTAPHPAVMAAVPSYAPTQGYVPSALGGGAALPPPVPYGR